MTVEATEFYREQEMIDDAQRPSIEEQMRGCECCALEELPDLRQRAYAPPHLQHCAYCGHPAHEHRAYTARIRVGVSFGNTRRNRYGRGR